MSPPLSSTHPFFSPLTTAPPLNSITPPHSQGRHSTNLFPHICPCRPASTSKTQNCPLATAGQTIAKYTPTQAKYSTSRKVEESVVRSVGEPRATAMAPAMTDRSRRPCFLLTKEDFSIPVQ